METDVEKFLRENPTQNVLRQSFCACAGEVCKRNECEQGGRCVCKHLGDNHPLNH